MKNEKSRPFKKVRNVQISVQRTEPDQRQQVLMEPQKS